MNTGEKRRWLYREKDMPAGDYIGMFDLAKGLLMIQIILSHCFDHYDITLHWGLKYGLPVRLLLSPLTMVHYGLVPMLFMICGYSFRRQSVKKSKKKTWSLFWPPYFCAIILVTICVLAKQALRGGNLMGRMFYQVLPFFLGLRMGTHLTHGWISTIGPMWFVLTYALGCVYLNAVLREKQTWLQAMMLAVGTAAALMVTEVPLPLCIQQTMICTGFMFAGMQVRKTGLLQRRLPAYAVAVVYLLCIVSVTRRGCAYFSINAYQRGGTEILIAYVTGLVMLMYYQRLNVFQGLLADGIRWIGRHMVWLCCIHTVCYLVVPWKRVTAYFAGNVAIGIAIEFAFSLLAAIVGAWLIEVILRRRLMRKMNRNGR